MGKPYLNTSEHMADTQLILNNEKQKSQWKSSETEKAKQSLQDVGKNSVSPFCIPTKSPEKLQQQLKSSLVTVKFLIDVRISNVLSMIVFFCNTVSLKHVRAVTRLSGQLTQRNGVMRLLLK